MESLQLKSLLEGKGIKPSLHRLKILDYLFSHRTHPTVDMIYQDIHKDIPTLSKTTIYNTLKTFVENDIVQAITIEDNEVRFDACVESHAHLKCVKCNSLYDIDMESTIFTMDRVEGHLILQTHVYFKGICSTCLEKSPN
jgi:Fe2+ or Zn2+ uptake regulation protein